MANSVYFQVIASLTGGARKSVTNLSEAKALEMVAEFVEDGTITTTWGAGKPRKRQAHELRVYQTAQAFNRKGGVSLDDFLKRKRKRNVFSRLEKQVKQEPRYTPRVFVVMPIQGDKYGTQSEQNILKEYDERFAAIEEALDEFDCVAIRIDKEQTLDELVGRIKEEIRRARFVVADLTDARPSCYFEAGYAEALGTPIIYMASKESVMVPGEKTKIHFDIHQNVRLFTNHEELKDKLTDAVEKNRGRLLSPPARVDPQQWSFRPESAAYRAALLRASDDPEDYVGHIPGD